MLSVWTVFCLSLVLVRPDSLVRHAAQTRMSVLVILASIQASVSMVSMTSHANVPRVSLGICAKRTLMNVLTTLALLADYFWLALT